MPSLGALLPNAATTMWGVRQFSQTVGLIFFAPAASPSHQLR